MGILNPELQHTTPISLEEVIRTFEQRGAKHISARIRFPREVANVSEYFKSLGIFVIDDSGFDAKLSILLDEKIPASLVETGISAAAIYRLFFELPQLNISVDEYSLIFNNLEVLKSCTAGFKATRIDSITGVLPYTLTAKRDDWTAIMMADAVNPMGPMGLTTEDSYILKSIN